MNEKDRALVNGLARPGNESRIALNRLAGCASLAGGCLGIVAVGAAYLWSPPGHPGLFWPSIALCAVGAAQLSIARYQRIIAELAQRNDGKSRDL